MKLAVWVGGGILLALITADGLDHETILPDRTAKDRDHGCICVKSQTFRRVRASKVGWE